MHPFKFVLHNSVYTFREIKPLPTDVGRIGCMFSNVLKYGLFIYRPTCRTEVSPSPEMPAPEPLAPVSANAGSVVDS